MSLIRTGCWISESSDFTTYNELGDSTIAYQFLADELIPDTQYFLKSWAENERGVVYSEVESFVTASDIPQVTALVASNIDADSATITATASGSYYSIASYHFILKDTSGSTVDEITQVSNIWDVTGLSANTVYEMFVTATNTNGNVSQQYSGGTFVTSVSAPIVSLTSLEAVTPTQGTLTYSITSQAALSSVLLEVADNDQFTGSTTVSLPTTSGSGQTANVTMSDTAKSYYVRVVATNGGGSTTSSMLSIEPLATVSITDITSITESSAVVTISVV